MQANTGKVCAQLTSAQLENGFTYTEETYNNTAWLKYAASILFMGGITNAFSQSAIWEFKPTKTEQQSKTTSNSTTKDSINIQGTIINAVTNKSLIYPMLVEIQTKNNKLTTGLSDKNGRFKLMISNTVKLENIKVVLHYQNNQNDTIQVPKEHVSFEKLENINEYRLEIRTAVNSEVFRKEEQRGNFILGGISAITVCDKNETNKNEFVIVNGVKIRRDKVSSEDIPDYNSNGTPANMESKP